MAKTKEQPTEVIEVKDAAPRTPADLARELFDAVAAKDVDGVAHLWHADVVDDFVAIGRFHGADEIKGFFTELFAAFPDFRMDVEGIFGDDRHAVVQWEASGTFTGGPFQSIEPNGRHVTIRGVDVMEIEDGLLRDNTIYYDGAAFARQIGMLPRQGSAADRAVLATFNAATRLRAKLRQRGSD
jgi:steroid delta-isomerase-like uncharacterized protein